MRTRIPPAETCNQPTKKVKKKKKKKKKITKKPFKKKEPSGVSSIEKKKGPVRSNQQSGTTPTQGKRESEDEQPQKKRSMGKPPNEICRRFKKQGDVTADFGPRDLTGRRKKVPVRPNTRPGCCRGGGPHRHFNKKGRKEEVNKKKEHR